MISVMVVRGGAGSSRYRTEEFESLPALRAHFRDWGCTRIEIRQMGPYDNDRVRMSVKIAAFGDEHLAFLQEDDGLGTKYVSGVRVMGDEFPAPL